MEEINNLSAELAMNLRRHSKVEFYLFQLQRSRRRIEEKTKEWEELSCEIKIEIERIRKQINDIRGQTVISR